MQEKLSLNTVFAGILCCTAFLAALSVHLFGFGNHLPASESMFWAMPMVCPVAYLAYLRSKTIGAAVQLILYSLATAGAYQVIDNECRLGNCSTRNPAAMLLAGMFAGMHMIAMFTALLLMCIGAAKMIRSSSVA